MEINKLINIDCIKYMNQLQDNSIDLTLTDIPYDEVNRTSNGLRNLDKNKADEITFDLDLFISEVVLVKLLKLKRKEMKLKNWEKLRDKKSKRNGKGKGKGKLASARLIQLKKTIPIT